MLVQFMIEDHGVSQRQACKTLSVPRSTFHYRPKPKNDMPVIQALEELVAKHPAIGFWQSHYRLRRKGHLWNHKKVYHLFCHGTEHQAQTQEAAAGKDQTGPV